MKTYIKIVLILLLIYQGLSATDLARRPYRFKHLKLNEGISNTITNTIIQDRQGFMWFGTFYGLIKYDGVSYQAYRHSMLDSTSISSDEIVSLYEDSQGYLWVGTWTGGLNRFNPDTGNFKKIGLNSNDSLGLHHPIVYAITEDTQKNIYIGADDGLYKYSSSMVFPKGHIETVQIEISNSAQTSLVIRSLYTDHRSHVWAGTQGGKLLISVSNKRFRQIAGDGRFGGKAIVDIMEGSSNKIWLATRGNGLFESAPIQRARPSNLYFKQHSYNNTTENSISNDNVWAIEEDRDGQIWICTDNGVNVYFPKTQSYIQLFHDPLNSSSISSNKTSTIYRDRYDVLWIGTSQGSIDKMVPAIAQYDYFIHNPFDPNSLSGKNVTAIYEDKGAFLWIGTENGLNKMRKTDKGYINSRIFFSGKNQFMEKDNHITAITGDDRQNLWVGTQSGLRGIFANHRVQTFNLPITSYENEQSNIITCLLYDSHKRLWVGTVNNGLNLFDTENKRFYSFRSNPGLQGSLADDYILSLYEDPDHQVWAGTFSGLKRINVDSTIAGVPYVSFEYYGPRKSTGLLESEPIYALYKHPSDGLYAGTDRGLKKLDPKTNKLVPIKQVRSTRGVICGIVGDNQGNLWISTYNGLLKYDPENNMYHDYYALYELHGNIFTIGAYNKNAQGVLTFGGVNGAIRFDPSSIRTKDRKAPLVLTSFKVFDEDKNFPIRISKVKEIHLSYKENFFTFSFATLDYRLPNKNQYYYFLDGFNRDWVFNGSKNVASYTNLDPGSYVFRVRGSNSDGIWNEDDLAIRLTIEPPLWQTWWFRSLEFLLILTAPLLIILYIRRREKKKTDINKKIAELKLQALRAQMNPHFIFNTINSIQYFISCNDQKSAFLYLSKFSKLMRQTLENSEHTHISLKSEIDSLRLYMDLQKLRFENKFDYVFQIASKIDTHSYEIPPMLLQPYIENAINHGFNTIKENGLIEISIMAEKNMLICKIDDNGIGINKARARKKATNHHSSGMRLTRERVEILNYEQDSDVSVSVVDLAEIDPERTGTRVIIYLPQNHTT